MERICAWCGTHLGLKEPINNSGVAASICRGCADHLAGYRNPVLVVSHKWARLYDELVELLRDRPEIQVVLDRRGPAGSEGGWNGPDRRGTRPPLSLE